VVAWLVFGLISSNRIRISPGEEWPEPSR